MTLTAKLLARFWRRLTTITCAARGCSTELSSNLDEDWAVADGAAVSHFCSIDCRDATFPKNAAGFGRRRFQYLW